MPFAAIPNSWCLKQHVMCFGPGSMLCDQAAFILEWQARGAKVTDLAEILFVWAEGSLVPSPLSAEKVSHLESKSSSLP